MPKSKTQNKVRTIVPFEKHSSGAVKPPPTTKEIVEALVLRKKREWEAGKAWVFDDTIDHEAWNDSDEPRAVLIFDVWSPFLSNPERELIRALTKRMGEFYGTMPTEGPKL